VQGGARKVLLIPIPQRAQKESSNPGEEATGQLS